MKADRAELVRLMSTLLADATAAETVDDAMYKLVLSYSIEKASKNIADGKGIAQEEVKLRMAQWREQSRMTES